MPEEAPKSTAPLEEAPHQVAGATRRSTMTLKRHCALAIAAIGLLSATIGSASASAAFGLKAGSVDATVLDEGGQAFSQAGGHPPFVDTVFKLNTELSPRPIEAERNLHVSAESPLRDLDVRAPAGFVGNPTATPRCSLAEFLNSTGNRYSQCRDATQVGTAVSSVNYLGAFQDFESAIYNLTPQEGQPALF